MSGDDCSTDAEEGLQQETLCRRQWTDEYVEHPETLMTQNGCVGAPSFTIFLDQELIPHRYSSHGVFKHLIAGDVELKTRVGLECHNMSYKFHESK